MHFRTMFDVKAIGSWDLEGRDCVVTITAVKAGTVEGEKGRKDKKAMISFREFDLPLVCNITNAKTIAGMYGADTRTWVGKRITLYPTTTSMAGKTVDCIRVRPTPPKGEPQQRKAAGADHPAAPIAAAKSADDLLDAIAGCAGWLAANHEKAWPRVLERCRELGVTEDQAVEVLAKAVPSSEPAA